MSSYIEPRWENKHAPCGGNNGCPAFTDIAASLHAVAIDDYKLAWEIMMETHPLRSTLGRVCYSFCEQPCNRGDFDSPIAIKALEAVIGDVGFDPSFRPKLKKRVGKKVAIIGAGPAGLAAGWFLNIHGFDVTILERESKPGGMLEYGIPSYRLPKDILKRETDLIIDSGIGIRYNEDIDLAKLEKFVSDHKYDALLVASGSSNERPATFKGSTGALSGIKLLKDINQAKANRTTLKKKDVIVIGGGNVAMDVSRSAIRLGAKSVTIVYRRTRELMPAFPIEIEEAIDEGVKFEFLRAPTSYSNGNLQVEIMQLEDIDSSGRQRPVGTGKHTKLKGDEIIVAIGQVPAIDIATLPSNIYVAGDVVPTSK
ncbi:MAG: FAD-dependent oxidoreductase, partial [Nitrospinota bacterium]